MKRALNNGKLVDAQLQELAADIVDFIKTLPSETEVSLSRLVPELYASKGIECKEKRGVYGWSYVDAATGEELYEDDDLRYLLTYVEFFAAREGILLDRSAYDNMIVGLPENIPFVIRHGVSELEHPKPFYLCCVRMPVELSMMRFVDGELVKGSDQGSDEEPELIFNMQVTNEPVPVIEDSNFGFSVCAQPIGSGLFAIAAYIGDEQIFDIGVSDEEDFFEYKEPMLDAYTPWYFIASEEPIDAERLLKELAD